MNFVNLILFYNEFCTWIFMYNISLYCFFSPQAHILLYIFIFSHLYWRFKIMIAGKFKKKKKKWFHHEKDTNNAKFLKKILTHFIFILHSKFLCFKNISSCRFLNHCFFSVLINISFWKKKHLIEISVSNQCGFTKIK